MKRRKKLYAVTAAAVCGIIAAGSIGCHFLQVSAQEQEKPNRTAVLQHGDLDLTFTGEGTTSEGTVSQKPTFDVSAADFTVEEVYVENGVEVTEGDALYKLSEESLAKANAYYEEQVAEMAKETEKARQEYETGKAEADYTRTEAKTAAESAESVYNAANQSLAQNVADAETALNDAKTQIAVYQNNLNQNTYYKDAGVEEKKDALKSAKEAEQKAQSEYQKTKSAYDKAAEAVNTKIAELAQTAAESADSAADAGTLSEKIISLSEANQSLAENKTLLANAESAYQAASAAREKAKEEYDAANTEYEKAVSEATAKKETLENSLSSLELAYSSAVNVAETGKVENQNTYDVSVMQGETADTVYESTVDSLKKAYDTAMDELEELKEEQAALQALTDGVITAEYSGTLSGVLYEAGDIIGSNTALVSYSDTNILTVAVEVSQENIAKIAVGDTVQINVPGMQREELTGTVSTVASEATSGRSMSNVTYTVEATFDNNEGSVSSNESAYVVFSYGALEDVDYIESDALSHVDGEQATVIKQTESGETEQTTVTIGESTDRFTVITDGITPEDICLIEMEGEGQNEAAQ